MSDARLEAVGRGFSLNVGTHVDQTMPRPWFPIIMEGMDAGHVVVFYLSGDRKRIKIGDVTGDSEKSYDVIVPAE